MKPCSEKDDQKKCPRYIKATNFDRCMHLKFETWCGNGNIFTHLKQDEKIEQTNKQSSRT